MFVRPPRRFAILLAVATAIASLDAIVGSAYADSAAGFPYVAYVIEPDTYIRSGPGREHYPTAQLPAGYAVEVYRHDAGGWCAIRPPEGSFSLVPVHQLRIIDQRTAEVVADGVVARVGSGLAAQRNAVQVLLQRGEVVQVVEQPKPGDQWVRVAPPSGEFRWIAARRLSRTPPTEGGQQKPVDGRGWQAQSSGAGYSGSPAIVEAAPIPWPGEESQGDAAEAFTHLSPAVAAAATGDEVEIVAGSPAETQLAGFETEAGASTSAKPAVADASATLAPPPLQPAPAAAAASPPAAADSSATPPPRIRFTGSSATSPSSNLPADPRVAEMQLRLSQVVVQPPANWQLVSLREETAALLAQEPKPETREELRDLLDRIATFETIQSRYTGARPLPPVTGAPAAQLAAAPPANGYAPPAQFSAAQPSAIGTSNSADVLSRIQSDLGRGQTTPTPGGPGLAPEAPITEAKYDAVGTLKPVVSRRENAPRYALVDDHGDVVTFVTASADLNLQPYVGQRIGVRGSRGFMPEYRRAHVTASRVTPLEETVVR